MKWNQIFALGMGAALSFGMLAGCGGTSSQPSAAPSATPSAAQESSTPENNNTPAELTTVEAGKLIMSTNAQFPPYEMVADDGSFEGIDVEVAEAIADKLGLELEIDDMDFDSALLAAQNGKSDMVMAGVTVNEERLQVMDFSDSYANGVQVVIVTEDSTIASVDDLANVDQIGTQRGALAAFSRSSGVSRATINQAVAGKPISKKSAFSFRTSV